jgi:hypothetical protein
MTRIPASARVSLWQRAIEAVRERLVGALAAHVETLAATTELREQAVQQGLARQADETAHLRAAVTRLDENMAAIRLDVPALLEVDGARRAALIQAQIQQTIEETAHLRAAVTHLDENMAAIRLDVPALLEVDGARRAAAIQAQIQQTTQETAHLRTAVMHLGENMAALQQATEESVRRLTGERMVLAEARLKHLETHTIALAGELERAQARREWLSRIVCMTALVQQSPPNATLVSVVLPTRNRPALLGVAVASVLAQTHAAWELLVVDTSHDNEARVPQDPRIRVITGPGLSAAAARNRALDEVRGSAVAYLDDDNTMAPDWLHAVAWAFAQHPDADVLYGAQVVEEGAFELPPLQRGFHVRFEPWDRSRLERGNYIDLGALAHRHPLAEARFKSGLEPVEDWDLLLRLTADRDPLCLPVHSGVYRTHAPDRLTTMDATEVMARIRASLLTPVP